MLSRPENEGNSSSKTSTTTAVPSGFFKIPLRELFEYSSNAKSEGPGLDMFKSSGLTNLETELKVYELSTRQLQEGSEAEKATHD